jgi:glycosyltransferase involved in cell wall biosynthesis
VRDLWPACFVDLGVIRNQRIIRLLERWELSLYRRANHIVTVTSAFKDDLVRRSIPSKKITSIPNGADEEFWVPQGRSGFLDQAAGGLRGFNVLYIGAHGISQALIQILEAAQEFKDCTDVRFFLVGDGAEKAKLQILVREMGLSNVHFMDAVDKNRVRACYADADVCLVPLRNIPLFKTFIPSKMFEMLAMGCPIVASVEGEAAGILRASGGAVIVPPEDSRLIAASIQRIKNDPKLAATMGIRGRAFVIANYSRRALAARYIEALAAARNHHR